MYNGFNKDNGSVIGRVGGGATAVDLADTQDTVGGEESLIGFDENGDSIALVAQLHPESGEVQWTPTYDLNSVKRKTVAMSQMTSMLRDNDRNKIYEAAIQTCIEWYIKTYSDNPVVLDIGCGTGLLSLLSAKHGAKYTFGVEMFDEMASIASDTILMSNYGDKVTIINAKSSDIEELPMPVDIIVSELLDSALLGEGCIPSHADAIQRFMKQDELAEYENGLEGGNSTGLPSAAIGIQNRVIPNRAVVYATCIESTEVNSMISVQGIKAGNESFQLFRNEYAERCQGGWPLIPVHWDILHGRGARKLSAAVPCLNIDFCSPLMEMEAATFDTTVQIMQSGTVHGIMLWWKTYLLSAELDPTGNLHYTTEPGAQNWQDHWQQTIFPLPNPILCNEGDIVKLHVSHDSVSIWVSAAKVLDPARAMKSSGMKRSREESIIQTLKCVVARRPHEEMDIQKTCACGWHLLYGADRMLLMHDYRYNAPWDTAMSNLVQRLAIASTAATPAIALDLSDGSLLSISLGMKSQRNGIHSLKIISRERKTFASLLYSQLTQVNDLQDRLLIWDGEDYYNIAEFLYDAQNAGEKSKPTTDSSHSSSYNSNAIAVDGEEVEDEADEEERSDEEILAIESYAGQLQLHALISDCNYFQLHALPIWQALSFHYQRTALASRLASDAIIVPSTAQVMIMPMELPNLRNCHGLIDTVSGFDHTALDARQEHWYSYSYPYRLSNYRKRALGNSYPVAMMNFQLPIQSFAHTTTITMNKPGVLDGLVLWVDYQLDNTEGTATTLRYWNGVDFPAYATQTIRFLPISQQVHAGQQIVVDVQFMVGQSDVEFKFTLL